MFVVKYMLRGAQSAQFVSLDLAIGYMGYIDSIGATRISCTFVADAKVGA